VLRRALAFFLPAAVVLTVACGLIFVGLQQTERMGANDPQQQLAEDAARALDGGAAPTTLVSGSKIDIAVSLAPFVAIYDPSGAILATDGTLDGAAPRPPTGVLDTARSAGIDKVTWQPRVGVRTAVVAVPWRGGTVLAGRSLRIVEERVGQLQVLAAVAWLVGVVLVGLASAVASAIVARRA
jgi:hypothetical protein